MSRLYDRFGVLCFLTLLSSTVVCSQSNQINSFSSIDAIDTTHLLLLLQDEVVENIKKKHIAPPKIDDQFSTVLFSNWIDIVDPNKIFLFEKEMKKLGKSLYELDDQLQKNELAFFEQSRKFVLQGIERNLEAFEELKKSDFDFSIRDSYNVTSEYTTYIKTEQELKQRYRQYAKFKILELFEGVLSEATKEKSVKTISKDSLLASAKEEFFNLEKGKFKLLSIKDRINYFEDYLGAVVKTFDPYCDYYSEVEKQDYDVELTGKVVGIGVFIENEHGQNQVGKIAIGGPAWRTDRVEIGDVILGATSNDGQYHSFEDATIIETASIIRGKIGTSLTVHFLSKDSIQKDVKIYREEFLSYGEQVKALILNRDSANDVGYIDIRKFYKSKTPGKHSSSAEDVINYLKHFEQNRIESLVVDLRDCVGGVLDESLSILGALVGNGPLLQARDKKDSISVYQSESKKPVYTGEIIVLANQNSASAAEILASALQDYNRAIIVGGKTFGKGTVQTFCNLEESALNKLPLANNYGWLKFTFSKYYRVNGDATQLIGVTPDIVLPGILDSVAETESLKKNAIPWSQIEPVEYEKYTSFADKLRTLNVMSKIRVASNSDFKNVKDAAIELKELYAQTKVPLNLSDYRSYEFLKNTKLRNASNASYSEAPLMDVSTTSLQGKLSMTAEESRWMTLRSQDIYLNEAINIFSDLRSMP